MKKNKAFTFAELMICLLVISVVAAILYPTMAKFSPNSNKPLFKSAYRITSNVLSELTNENIKGEIPLCADAVLSQNNSTCVATKDAGGLCEGFCKEANTLECECNATVKQLQTSNGMRWAFYYNAASGATPEHFSIIVDVNASNNNLSSHAPSNVFTSPWNSGTFYYSDANILSAGRPIPEVVKTQDTFKIDIDTKGKIINISTAGWLNLEDTAIPD